MRGRDKERETRRAIWLRIIMITGGYSPRAGNDVDAYGGGWKAKLFSVRRFVHGERASRFASFFVVHYLCRGKRQEGPERSEFTKNWEFRDTPLNNWNPNRGNQTTGALHGFSTCGSARRSLIGCRARKTRRSTLRGSQRFRKRFDKLAFERKRFVDFNNNRARF